MGFPPLFVNMVKLTLADAEASINVNGRISSSFRIERGVRQGCPLAPFLFLIMSEALHATIQQAQEQGRITGVKLPRSESQQLTLQFADDTSFTVKADHGSVTLLVNLLNTFSSASGLTINWSKSGAYWVGRNRQPLDWALTFGWTWVPDGNITKLLGTPFGLSLATTDIDQFLIAKVRKKLTY